MWCGQILWPSNKLTRVGPANHIPHIILATFTKIFMVHYSTNHNIEFYRSFLKQIIEFFVSFLTKTTHSVIVTLKLRDLAKMCCFITKNNRWIGLAYYTIWALQHTVTRNRKLFSFIIESTCSFQYRVYKNTPVSRSIKISLLY